MIRDDIDKLLADLPSEGRSARLRRNSLLVLREKFGSTVPPLRVQVSDDLTATGLASLTKALQRATSLSAKLLMDPKSDSATVSQELAARTQLVPRAQVGHLLLFGFPHTGVHEEHVVNHRPEHIVERAVRELLAILPETAQDTRALEALPGRRTQLRAAVSELAGAVDAASSVALTLSSPGGDAVESSVLTRDQAREVHDVLADESPEVSLLTIQGTMDGMRTQRRLFYLVEAESGREYSGGIEENQLSEVRSAIGSPIVATLRRLVIARADGTKSRPSYSLVSIRPAPERIEGL